HTRARRRRAGGAALAVAAAMFTVATGGAAAVAHGDPRTLQADLVVAADGSGTHTDVQSAVDDAEDGYTILIEPGTYHGNVTVPRDKTGLTFLGSTGDPADVVLTDDRCASCDDGSGGTWGTTGSASVTLDGDDFTAE